jgi:hypothetical protein
MSDTFPPQSTRRHPPSPDGDDTPRIWTGRDSTPTPPPPRLAVDSARARVSRARTPRRPMASTVAFSHALSARAATSVRGSNDKKVHARRATATTASKPRSLVVRTDRRDRARTDGSKMRCVGEAKRARERERGTTRTRERAWGTRARIILARDHRETARTRRRARGWMDARVWDRVGSRARYPRAIGTRDRGSRTRARGGGVGENASSHARGWPGRARRDGRGRGARGRRRRVKGRSVSRDA